MVGKNELDNLIQSSKSRDGYIREAAVYKLAQYNDELVLPALLQRLNDYVAQVRHVVRMNLYSWLKVEHLPVLLNYTHCFLHTENQSRADNQWLLSQFLQLIESDLESAKISEFLKQKQGKAVRALFILTQRQGWFCVEELFELTLYSVDPVVRNYALQCFIQAVPDEQIRLLVRFNTTVNSQLRYRVLLYAVQHLPRESWKDLLYQALVSPAQSLMTLGYYYLHQQGWAIEQLLKGIVDQSISIEQASVQILKLMQWRHKSEEWEWVKQHYSSHLEANPVLTLKTRLMFDEHIDADDIVRILKNNLANDSDLNGLVRYLSGLNAEKLDYLLTSIKMPIARQIEISQRLSTWEYMQFILYKMQQSSELEFIDFQSSWNAILIRLRRADLYPTSLSEKRRESIQSGLSQFHTKLSEYFSNKSIHRFWGSPLAQENIENLNRFGLFL